jgi:hypothetical protein
LIRRATAATARRRRAGSRCLDGGDHRARVRFSVASGLTMHAGAWGRRRACSVTLPTRPPKRAGGSG